MNLEKPWVEHLGRWNKPTTWNKQSVSFRHCVQSAKMASPSIIVFHLLELRDQEGPSEGLVGEIKQLDGCEKVLFGRKLEDTDFGVLCTRMLKPSTPGLGQTRQ